jgi:hypothetical protein
MSDAATVSQNDAANRFQEFNLRLSQLQSLGLEFLHIGVAFAGLVTYQKCVRAVDDSRNGQRKEGVPVAGEDSTHVDGQLREWRDE